MKHKVAQYNSYFDLSIEDTVILLQQFFLNSIQ